MNEINQRELDEIIEKHEEWIKDSRRGERMVIEYSNLEYLNFSKRNLEGAILRYCDLQFANFIGTNLKEVDLKGSDLRRSELRLADLGNAILKGADLTEAFLYKTNLFYANIDNMISCGNLGEHNRVVYYFYKENRIICGCFDGTLEEFESELLKKYKEDDNYFKALEMFKKIKR